MKLTAACAYVLALVLFVMGMVFADQDFYGWFLAGGWLCWFIGATATVRIVWEAME